MLSRRRVFGLHPAALGTVARRQRRLILRRDGRARRRSWRWPDSISNSWSNGETIWLAIEMSLWVPRRGCNKSTPASRLLMARQTKEVMAKTREMVTTRPESKGCKYFCYQQPWSLSRDFDFKLSTSGPRWSAGNLVGKGVASHFRGCVVFCFQE